LERFVRASHDLGHLGRRIRGKPGQLAAGDGGADDQIVARRELGHAEAGK
jgi:hypothetical protein